MAPKSKTAAIRDFTERSKMALLANDQYENWCNTVNRIEATKKLDHLQAMIEGARDFPCLAPILAELDGTGQAQNLNAKVKCEGKELPYIDNVRWAIAAAGETHMTKRQPRKCPNTTAWYLYQQALEDPGKFCSLVNTAEGKASSDSGPDTEIQKNCKKSIEELDRMLMGLEQ